MICRAQFVNEPDGAIWSRKYDSSRCVCALTSPGMTATSPNSARCRVVCRAPSERDDTAVVHGEPAVVDWLAFDGNEPGGVITNHEIAEWQDCRMAGLGNPSINSAILKFCHPAIRPVPSFPS